MRISHDKFIPNFWDVYVPIRGFYGVSMGDKCRYICLMLCQINTKLPFLQLKWDATVPIRWENQRAFAMVYLLEQEIIEVLSKTNSSPQDSRLPYYFMWWNVFPMVAYMQRTLFGEKFDNKITDQNERAQWYLAVYIQKAIYSAVHYHLTVKQLNLRINLTSHWYIVFSLHKPEVIIWPWWPVK